ncbi:hypothetical protein X777_00439, partial [Ooceraea biroi]
NKYREDQPCRDHTRATPEKKWCRYCKNVGHEIEECRKRQYNNSQRESGNASRPSGQKDEARAGPSREPHHPIRTIESEPIERSESPC